MLVWIENAPKLEKNTEEEIIQFVDNYLACSTDDGEIGQLVELQSHKHSKFAERKERQYADLDFLCLLSQEHCYCILWMKT